MQPARFQDGKTAASHQVTLEWRAGEIRILREEDGVELDLWPLEEIRRIQVPGANDQLHLSRGHGAGARLILSDPEACDWIRGKCPDLNRKPERERGWWRGYAVWGSAAIGSLTMLFLIVIPAFSGLIVELIPLKWEQKFGITAEQEIIRGLAFKESLTTEEIICRSPAGLAALNKMMARLTALESGRREFSIHVLDTDIPNAMALPGERILVLRGLLDMAENPNAVAGVLAHELGHVRSRDSMNKVVETSAVSILLGLVLGDVTGGAILTGLSDTALNSAYSRDKERRADRYAVDLMNHGGFDAVPLSDLLEKLTKDHEEMEEMLSWMSSHPVTKDRKDFIHEHAMADGTSILTDSEWQDLKNICDPTE